MPLRAALSGAAQPDVAANKRIYGKDVAAADILTGQVRFALHNTHPFIAAQMGSR
jgi:hypothetical protein